MFKNYHVVIFKDREGAIRNLKLRGWLSIVFIVLFVLLAVLNLFLWGFYHQAGILERELVQSQHLIQAHDSQMLSLAAKLQELEQDVRRVQYFDAKLRVLMNIGLEQEQAASETEQTDESEAKSILQNPDLLARHRELFSRKMHSLIDELSAAVQLEEVRQQELTYFSGVNKDILASTPSIWPAKGYLSSGFGYRKSPFTGKRQMHAGIDIANRPGTNIIAPANGTVTFADSDGAYGLVLVISHGNTISTRYAHLQKTLVKQGQTVQRGEVIATMGSSGRSTGPHLHYEVRIGNVPVNPMRYILN